MNLVFELERLADGVGSRDNAESPQVPFRTVAELIAKNLAVRPDEVAILGISNRWRHLYFIVPEELKNVGFVPLSSKSALAARTALEASPEIINDFASVKHASVFEGVKTAAENAEPIHKIISAPIFAADRVVGVIQISRKGAHDRPVGPHFTSEDLRKVLAICKPLGRLLEQILSE